MDHIDKEVSAPRPACFLRKVGNTGTYAGAGNWHNTCGKGKARKPKFSGGVLTITSKSGANRKTALAGGCAGAGREEIIPRGDVEEQRMSQNADLYDSSGKKLAHVQVDIGPGQWGDGSPAQVASFQVLPEVPVNDKDRFELRFAGGDVKKIAIFWEDGIFDKSMGSSPRGVKGFLT